MRKFMISAGVMATLAGLAGCATTPRPVWGNYAAASLDDNKTMADATVAQLVSLYPPAHTRFNLQQPTTDAYGSALLAALRDKGYSVQEYTPQPHATPASYPAAVPTSTPAQNMVPQQLPSAANATTGILAQPVTTVPAKTESVQTPATDPDMAKQFLAQDAAKVIQKPHAKASAMPPIDKDKKPDAIAQQDDAKAATGKEEIALPVKTEVVKQVTAQVRSDVVEVEPVVKAEPLPAWSAQAGTTLRQTIEGWSHKQGWDVRWESELLDYPIEGTFSMIGEYLDVITRTFELYKDAKRPFKVEVYPSQKLVVVKEKK